MICAESDLVQTAVMIQNSSLTAISLAKRQLRQNIRQILKCMSAEEKSRQSAHVLQKLKQNTQFMRSARIAIYVSLDAREVHTHNIFELCFSQSKRVFVPKYEDNSRHMDCYEVKSMQDLSTLPATDKWRISQPGDDDLAHRAEALSSGGLDMILVPGVAFTRDGQRLGNGYAYFDTYLHRCANHVTRPYLIGLAFNEQIVESIPSEEHDIKLDQVLCLND